MGCLGCVVGLNGDSRGRDGEKEGIPTWDNTYQLKLDVPPHFTTWCTYGGGWPMWGMVGGKAVLFELK